MIEIQVSNSTATLIPPRESLTPGMINAAQVHFTFSDEWVGLEKTAVFSNEIETVPADVVSDTTTLPTEILDAVYRWISVGVTGENGDGDVVIPTIWCRLGQVLPGTSGKYVTQDQLKAYWSKQEIVFILDGDGSRFLGDDGEYHYVAQGGGDVTHEELDDALALKLDKTEAEAEYAKKTDIPSTDDFATKEQLDALTDTIDGKADKTELAGYYSKSDVSIITNGDGKKFLADDGVYRIPESQGVTQGELDAAIAPLATKSELGQKADKSELASYAKQYDVNQALATKADKSEIAGFATTEALTAGLATKADNATLSNYALKSELPDTSQLATKSELTTGLAEKASKTELADGLAEKADKDEIITVTTGTGTLFLADDGTYKPAAGDPPDLSAYLTKTEASGTYATKTELADKADAADIADMLTKTEASGTYATKTELADKADAADIADVLTKTEASGTYATKTEVTNGLADKADKTEIITLTTGDGAQFLANDGTYKTVQVDPPDLTPYLTKTDAAAEYATKTELATKANQSEIITVTTGTGTLFLADDGTYKPAAGDPPDLSAYLTKTEAGTTYATKTELGSKADLSLVSALETDLNAKADKSEIPDVSGFETTTHAEATYATKTELAAKADASEMATALAAKADVTALDDYATKTELGDYATKTELGSKADLSLVSALETDLNAKADKTEIITVTTGDGAQFLANDGTYKTVQVDPPDLTPYLTKTDAAAEYATKTELEAKADDATVTALSGTVTANTAEIATLKTGKADKSEIITVDDGDGTKYLADDGTYKTVTIPVVDSTLIPGSPNPVSNDAVVTGFATYGTQIEQLNAQIVANAEAIEELESSKADVSDIPDVSGFETTAHAAETYATKDELPDTSNFLTITDAAATYQTIADASPFKTLTAGNTTVTADSNGNGNVGETVVSIGRVESASLVSEVAAITQFLPNGSAPSVENDFVRGAEITFVWQKMPSAEYYNRVIINRYADGISTTYPAISVPSYEYVADTFLTKTTASITYATKTDISGVIKGIKWGSTSAQVDDDGVAEIGSFALQKTSSAVPGWNTSEWRYIQNIPGVGAEQGVLVAYTRYTEANTVRSLSIFGVRVPTYNEFTEATGNMATQAWVQEYIASLDATNTGY